MEFEHFQKRTLAVAALQREGAILATGLKDDYLPLPYVYSLEKMTRAAPPYDYQCEWGRLKCHRDLSIYQLIPNDGQLPPGWEQFDLSTPIQPVTATIDRARRLALIQANGQEITLLDVSTGESEYTLVEQINSELVKARQPLVAWRLEWVEGEDRRLWAGQNTPTVRNDQTFAYLTGYACNDGNVLVYLGMAGHKTCLESIRATIQANRRRFLTVGSTMVWAEGRYYQLWQPLPDFGSHHAAIVSAGAAPGQWQPGDLAVYVLVFESDLAGGADLAGCARTQLFGRLAEALPVPLLEGWAGALWEAGEEADLVTTLTTGGDCLAGYQVALTEESWSEIVTRLLEEQVIHI